MNAQIEARLTAIGIRMSDVDERFIRGSGPGGQNINKVSATVWLRHRPSGLETRCQKERSQYANRLGAWEELCSKLEEARREAAAKKKDEREKNRRRNRQKSRGQKVRMIESKKHRAGIKSRRGRVGAD